MTMQLVAIDGVAVHLPQDATTGAAVQMAGGCFKVVPCPNAQVIGSAAAAGSLCHLENGRRRVADRVRASASGSSSAHLLRPAMAGSPRTHPLERGDA